MQTCSVAVDLAALDKIREVLIRAALSGAAEILSVRRSGGVKARIKYGRELVTAADERADAAILSMFRSELPKIDPGISFHLEESGRTGELSGKEAGADPLDGTSHFACGGNLYSVQAHYVEAGVPLIGVVFQPEVYLPLTESDSPVGRLVAAIRGAGAFSRRTEFTGDGFRLGEASRVMNTRDIPDGNYVACVPFSTKMSDAERTVARRVYESGIIAVSTGAGGAGANVMMAIFGGHHVYANFGAGEDLDLIPPQVIAVEAGLTVWGTNRSSPVWNVRKQPFIVAPNDHIAEAFLRAAGL